ncbi:MAG: V-type ATP synthase subunit A [candidate division SR1 bacterium]|nr:V-type ATP synthase subunit A [candidate division SR1 bacterium]
MLKITQITGPLVTAQIVDKQDKPMLLETVFVGDTRLLGEIIAIEGSECKVQVYEETSGLKVGEQVELRGELLSAELAPGLLGNMFDGIQRPLEEIDKISPIFIQPGIHIPSLDRIKKWVFHPLVKIGDVINPGDRLGYVDETDILKHFIHLPKDISGVVNQIKYDEFTIEEVIATIEDSDDNIHDVKMLQKWPVKIARPYKEKLLPKKIFRTGQRVIDAMFPIMLGAPVSTPGPFGAGKTFTQQQLAKWGSAQIVVYVGCGERGNEMTEMVKLFPTLKDPRTGKPIMERTVLIANTSNMPIAAREASIYTGITIAEYYRDMGYDVVLMADSTSRWAESMREISSRLGELPSEEGYPAYLSSRIASFYERAGVVNTLSGQEGSVTAIGTVSPAGGDFSEPVTQASLKSTQVFLALDDKLAAKRHYPSINWQTSYSLYDDAFNQLVTLEDEKNAIYNTGHLTYQDNNLNHFGGRKFVKNRRIAKQLLTEEDELIELVKLVGVDGLDNSKRLILEIAKSLREDFLQQNGFDPIDTFCSFDKCQSMLNIIISLYELCLELIEVHGDDENLVATIFNAQTKDLLTNLKYQESIDELNKNGKMIFHAIDVLYQL